MTDSPSPSNDSLPAEVIARTFVVMPAFNESACIAQVSAKVRALYPNVVVVDDGSTDDTFAAARDSATYVLRHPVNRGQGAALQTGIMFALARGAEYIVSFDSDGQHEVDDIAALVAPIHAGTCDVSLGSRFLGETFEMPLSRRVLLRLAVLFTRAVSRVRVTDTHNGLRAFSRPAAEQMNITLDRMAHASELLDQIRQNRLEYREVPVRVRYTDYSLAKGQSARGAIRILIHYIFGRMIR